MDFSTYDSIKYLSTTNNHCSIRVRVQAIWNSVTKETNEFKGVNLILTDEENGRIHAFISCKISDAFQNKIVEGEIYVISDFYLKEYNGDDTNRCVRNSKHIYFSKNTELQKDYEKGLNISSLCLDNYALEDLSELVEDGRFLCDVVGVIDQYDNKGFHECENEEKKNVRFTITDGSTTVRVTFFNELCKKMNEAWENINEAEVFINISSAKVGRYQGNVCLTNYPATRFYLNSNHYSVKSLRKVITTIKEYQHQKMLEDVEPEILTIQGIDNVTTDYTRKSILCNVTIKKIDTKQPWYYNVCSSCDEEVFNLQGRYTCKGCTPIRENIPFPDKRFRIGGLCTDHNGNSMVILLDDREVRSLIGKNVFEVELENVENDDAFPKALKELENRNLNVSLLLTKENIKKTSDVYNVIEICKSVEQVDSNVPTTDMQRSDTNSIISQDEGEIPKLNLYDTPSFDNSTLNSKTKEHPPPQQVDRPNVKKERLKSS